MHEYPGRCRWGVRGSPFQGWVVRRGAVVAVPRFLFTLLLCSFLRGVEREVKNECFK